MFDIEFYQKVFKYKYVTPEQMESFRSIVPVIYNIETTNDCNMRCEMCPRTTIMTRPIETMKPELFKKIISQVYPFNKPQWEKWESFVDRNYHISKSEMSENHFFLYIIPRVIVLHGYGDPLLDRNIPKYVRWMADKKLESYFSCNPANINMERTIETFSNGLGYIKYSIESTDDSRYKSIRGQAANFTESYKNIMRLLEIKAQRNYMTVIVITMLDLNKPDQQEEYQKLVEKFKGTDVYIYLKSQDQVWYENNGHKTNSIHWQEYCKFPWSSMTIKSNGEAVSCVEDFNNEIVLGDANENILYDIWNGYKYNKFRKDHYKLTNGIKCTRACDMKLIGEL